MYDLINQFAQTVVSTIAIKPAHVTDYEWLLQNVGQATQPNYQKKYREYWGMDAAQLSPAFYTAYFGALNSARTNMPTLSSLVQALYAASARKKGQKSLQFSFSTKLLHMTNQRIPIYDSRIAAFYFFATPANKTLQRRINRFASFHSFLIGEYGRVLQNNLLATAIQEFKRQLNPQHFTDEKIVDSLIWAFVGLLRKGALMNRQIFYS
jgi:hypothetical protein